MTPALWKIDLVNQYSIHYRIHETEDWRLTYARLMFKCDEMKPYTKTPAGSISSRKSQIGFGSHEVFIAFFSFLKHFTFLILCENSMDKFRIYGFICFYLWRVFEDQKNVVLISEIECWTRAEFSFPLRLDSRSHKISALLIFLCSLAESLDAHRESTGFLGKKKPTVINERDHLCGIPTSALTSGAEKSFLITTQSIIETDGGRRSRTLVIHSFIASLKAITF